MLRAVLAATGTVAGLVALFSYKTHVPGVTPLAEPSTPAALSATAPPMTTGSGAASSPAAKSTPKASTTPTPRATTKEPVTTPTTKAPAATPTSAQPTPTPTKTTPKPTPTPTQTAPSGTFTGGAVNTQYGAVQVQITVQNGKITNADGGLPQGGDSIAQNAIPQLNSEVLQAQSADIQSVSGATYTSQGYIGSLQQAINQAGL